MHPWLPSFHIYDYSKYHRNNVFLEDNETVAELVRSKGTMSKWITEEELKDATECDCDSNSCDEVDYCVSFQQKGVTGNEILKVGVAYRENNRRKIKRQRIQPIGINEWIPVNVDLKGQCRKSQVQ